MTQAVTLTGNTVCIPEDEYQRLLVLADQVSTLTRIVDIDPASIELAAGEHYAGLILDEEGQPSHHLVLLAGEAEEVTWQQAREWASGQCGDLPTRQEQSLLYANLKDHFQRAWYWSAAQSASDSGFAWAQDFNDGIQLIRHKDHRLRARAVRRLTI